MGGPKTPSFTLLLDAASPVILAPQFVLGCVFLISVVVILRSRGPERRDKRRAATICAGVSLCLFVLSLVALYSSLEDSRRQRMEFLERERNRGGPSR